MQVSVRNQKRGRSWPWPCKLLLSSLAPIFLRLIRVVVGCCDIVLEYPCWRPSYPVSGFWTPREPPIKKKSCLAIVHAATTPPEGTL